MTAENEEQIADVPEGFAVRDANSANWVIRKIVEARKYGEKVQAWAAAELRRAQREEEFFLRRFGVELEDWVRKRTQIQNDGRKSVSLPAGVVGFRIEQTKLEITDEAALINWCKANLPEAVKTVENVLKSAVMGHFKATGECPTGAEIGGGIDHLYIR